MPARPEDIAQLQARAHQVGLAIGWTMSFGHAPNPEFVDLTAGAIEDDGGVAHIVSRMKMATRDSSDGRTTS